MSRTFSTDRLGHEHAPKGSSEGGQFVKKGDSLPHPSKAQVKLGKYLTPEMLPSVVETFLGKDRTANDFASLVGAPDDSEVTIDVESDDYPNKIDSVIVYVRHKDFFAKRFVIVDKRGRRISNDSFVIKEHARGKGIGTKMFASQVFNAQSLGYTRIGCTANRNEDCNGYWTWPRLGYDVSIDDMREEVRERFPEAKSILDVMLTKEGRDWWKKNGYTIHDAVFDLTDNSRSMQVLNAYLEERKGRTE